MIYNRVYVREIGGSCGGGEWWPKDKQPYWGFRPSDKAQEEGPCYWEGFRLLAEPVRYMNLHRACHSTECSFFALTHH